MLSTMARPILCLLILLILRHTAIAQQTDSLERALARSQQDTNRVRLLAALIPKYQYSDTAKAGAYAREAVQLSTRLRDEYGLAVAYRLSGVLEANRSHFESAQQWYKKAQALTDGHHEYRYQVVEALLMQNNAVIYHFREDFRTAIELYLEASQRFEQLGKESLLFYTYNNMITLYTILDNYPAALKYALAEYKLSQKSNDPFQLGMSLQTLGLAKMKMKQYDSVENYLQRSAEYGAQLKNALMQTMALCNLAEYYVEAHQDYRKALPPALKSVGFAVQTGTPLYMTQAYDAVGSSYLGLGDYKQAMFYLRKTAAIAENNGLQEPAKYAYREMAELEEKLHRYEKADSFLHRFIDVNDSITKKTHEKQIDELESRYQAQKKEHEIASLRKEQEIQQLLLKKRLFVNDVLWGSTAALVIIFFLIYINFRRRSQLQKLKIRDLEQERQLVAVQSVMKGEEQERSRIARDLHDGVGGLLSGVKLSLKAIEADIPVPGESRLSLDHVVMQVDQSVAELRRVSHNIMPESLIRYGLKEAVENYCENLNQTGQVHVQVQSYGVDTRLDQSIEIIIYRMVQELLNNALKHSEAKKILVQMMRRSDRFNLTVEDDGRGFDTGSRTRRPGAGLSNIRARAEYLGGTVDIHSTPGAGTSINIEVNCV